MHGQTAENVPVAAVQRLTAAEFFAGVGLVGEALQAEGIEVVWANDIDPLKRRMFIDNYGADIFLLDDIRHVNGRRMPSVDLATASFPCTDVSLAGNRAGLAGEQSGMFWEFIRVLREMGEAKPRVVLLENVVGLSSSNGGEDLRSAFQRLNDVGYTCDLVLIDAKWFVPQSRPRLFIVGSLDPAPPRATGKPMNDAMRPAWYSAFLARHPELMTHTFPLSRPERDVANLDAVVEKLSPTDSRWWRESRKQAFLDSLSEINRKRLSRLMASGHTSWRTAYRRTRRGRPVWEIREDAISGCLRTARGGSSKQAVVEAETGGVRVRWMTAREYARLQGVPDFVLGGVSESQAMFGFGDAVCVPAVRWLIASYVRPLLERDVLEARDRPNESTPSHPRERSLVRPVPL